MRFGYRFGFNGKEMDNEVSGSANSYDYGARIYNSRLGRWMSLDPMQHIYPEVSDYSFVKNSPIIMVDPSGRVVVPYVYERTFLGIHLGCSYPDFFSNDNGETFAYNVLEMHVSNTSNIFQQVYDQLQNSTRIYKFQETYVGVSGAGDAIQKGLNSPDAYGSFQPGHKGNAADPYVINLNYDPGEIEGFNRKSTIFEEVFHAGQNNFYLNTGKSRTHLQIEVEAKVAKAFQGIPTGNSYEDSFREDPIVQKYIQSVKNGEEIGFSLQYAFEEKVSNFAQSVYEVYKKSWAEGGEQFLNDNNPSEFNASQSLDYLKSMLEINSAEPIIIRAKKKTE
jgi:RHS repeat-associated protein